jgi:hypothetical protein
VFATAHVLNLFVYEFARGSGRCFAFAEILFGAFDCFLFRHENLLPNLLY